DHRPDDHRPDPPMNADERHDRRSRRPDRGSPINAGPERRYWHGAPRREWMALLFFPVGGTVIIAWLVYEVMRSDSPRAAQWLALALGLAGGLVAALTYTLRLALEHRL